MTHKLNETIPPGVYKMKKMFIQENGKDKIVWTGDKSVTVTTVKVTDIFFDPAVVPMNGSYVCTIKGTFPPDTYFGAIFTTNDGPEQRVGIWQQGPAIRHQLNETIPAGIYKMKKMFIQENGKDKIVWTGDKSVTVK